MERDDLQRAYIAGYAIAVGCEEKDATLNNVIYDFENWYGKYYFGGTAFINGDSQADSSIRERIVCLENKIRELELKAMEYQTCNNCGCST